MGDFYSPRYLKNIFASYLTPPLHYLALLPSLDPLEPPHPLFLTSHHLQRHSQPLPSLNTPPLTASPSPCPPLSPCLPFSLPPFPPSHVFLCCPLLPLLHMPLLHIPISPPHHLHSISPFLSPFLPSHPSFPPSLPQRWWLPYEWGLTLLVKPPSN